MFKCLVRPISSKGFGGTNSVFAWVKRYIEETECFQVPISVRRVIIKDINVIFFHKYIFFIGYRNERSSFESESIV